ncbi:hypothetical protein [Neisseria lactamica]|uniref:hypothetical protein n=1 Tax=Neisseria lactamica TaxID=486 RepID=UPI0013053F02|nr:hypothetical protein [Neisseria lactamica]
MTVATTYPGMTAKGLQTASATVGWASAHQSTSKNEKKRWAEAHPTILPEARPAIIYASVYCSNCLLGNDGQWASDGISCLPLKQFAAQLFKRVRYVSTHRTTHKAPPYVSS